MGELVTTVFNLLSRRLFITAWLPALVFLTLLAALAATGLGWPVVLQVWDQLPVDRKFAVGLALLLITTLLAGVLYFLRFALIRLLEGYWAHAMPCGSRLAQRYRTRHQRIHAQYEGRLTKRHALWPDSYPRNVDRIMPTRLGNILRAGEEHAYLRYGIDSVTAWPRLYIVLPETFRQTFGSAAANLELAVIISVLGAAFAAIGGLLASVMLPWYAALLIVGGGMAVAWLGYQAALHAASGYAMLIRAAFDVHRWKLLEAMGLKSPTSYDSEREQWGQLRKLWREMGPDSAKAHMLRYPQDCTED